jgi:hypothetical protein
MAQQPSGWTQGPSDSEARWRARDRELKLHSFKVALGIFGGLAALSIFLMAAAHVVFLPFLTLIMGGRAAIIGWQLFGKGASAPAGYHAAPPAGWQQSAPVPPPPPPPPTWQPPSDLADWTQSIPAPPKSQGTPPPPPPPPAGSG